jgi:hypothetical protein
MIPNLGADNTTYQGPKTFNQVKYIRMSPSTQSRGFSDPGAFLAPNRRELFPGAA